MPYKGVLITLEGPERVGKTTQLRKLEGYLSERGLPVVVTREPGGTPEGDRIRAVLFDRNISDPRWTATAEAFLFEASRAMHWSHVIKPALKLGKIVVSDRFFDSTTAYQGVGGGLPQETIEDLNLLATEGYVPDLTLYLDMDPGEALKREFGDGEENRIDKRRLEYHRKVRAQFLRISEEEGGRWRVIDASLSPEAVFEVIKQEVDALLVGRGIERIGRRGKEREL